MNTVAQILGAVGEGGRDRTDSQLLELFVRLRDEDAFAAVVRRHGPMVLGVCRRVLRNFADADDAFQAAFLVLARKAATIAGRDQLGPWLHGVAFNASRKLKRANARRSVHESARAAELPTTAPAPETHADLLAVLDEELAKLPERYRAVIVLCDLGGRTRKEAAQVLACPEGTVGGRLARARDLLASRLRARGVSSAPGAVALAVAVAPSAVAALVRAVSIDGLAHAAAGGFVSRRVLDTTEGVVRSMFATKLQKVGAAVLCCGLALACTTGGIHLANAQPEPKPVPMLMDDPKPPLNPLALLGLPPEAPKAEVVNQKVATVVQLRELACVETAEALNKLFGPKLASITPLPSDKALLIYADQKTIASIREVLAKMGERAPKKATPFKLTKNADPAETAKTLTEVFGRGRAVFVPVSDERVLLVYASELDTETVRKLLAKVLAAEPAKDSESVIKTVMLKNSLVEEVAGHVRELLGARVQIIARNRTNQLVLQGSPAAVDTAVALLAVLDTAQPAKMFTVNFQNVAWADVLDWYAKESGLALVTTARPTGTVTLKSGNKQLTLGEVTDLINEALMQQKFVLLRRKTIFFLHPADEKLDPSAVRSVELKELASCGRTEIVDVSIPLHGLDAADIKDELRKLLTPFGDVVFAKGRLLIVRDTAGNVARIVQTLETIDKPIPGGPLRPRGFDPRFGGAGDPRGAVPPGRAEVDPRMVSPEAKPVTFKFKDAPWAEVLEAYEKVTGLKGTIRSKPGGTFTFLPKEAKQYTLAEFTDIVNDGLLVQKHLLIRRIGGFVVVAADEAIDPALVPRIAAKDLEQHGRTELVQVIISIPPAANELADAVKKMLGPFGRVVPVKPNQLLVEDLAGNVLKIRKALSGETEPKPEK